METSTTQELGLCVAVENGFSYHNTIICIIQVIYNYLS